MFGGNMAGPELMKRNMSLKDEKKVLEKMFQNMLQKLQKNLPKKVARSIQQITKDPKKQSKMLTEFRHVLAISFFKMNKIINSSKLTIEGKEDSIRKEIKSLGNKTFDVALKYYDPTESSISKSKSDALILGGSALGMGMGGTTLGASVLGSIVVVNSNIIGALCSLGCGVALVYMQYKTDRKTAKAYASIFASNVAKELGIKIAEFTPDVVPKKR